MNSGIYVFCLILIITLLALSIIAAKQTTSVHSFYTAGARFSGWQNGLALAGDYLSAGSFLGITGMIALVGFDGFFYSIGFFATFFIVLFVMAEPMRHLGRYTLSDVLAARFNSRHIRAVIAVNTLIIAMVYIFAQLVGAGALLHLLVGIEYRWSILIVGLLIMMYVSLGGMLATSWVQIIKALLILGSAIVLALLVLVRFNFNFNALVINVSEATPLGGAFLQAGNFFTSPLDVISLNLALILGTAGLPHILMRFFTVKNAEAARHSVVVATGVIGLFYMLAVIIGFGSAVFVGMDTLLRIDPAGNMAAPLLAELLGGPLLFSVITIVAFMTILAIVGGLVMSSAAAFGHDIYHHLFKRGCASALAQMWAAKGAAIGVLLVSMLMALFGAHYNIVFISALVFAIAASANFPAIVLTLYWRRFNRQGALWGLWTGLLSSVVLIAIGPTVIHPEPGQAIWVGNPLFPLNNPGIISIPLGFLGAILGTYLYRGAPDHQTFNRLLVKAHVASCD